MESKLYCHIKKNLQLILTENNTEISYLVKWQGKTYQEAVPIEDFIRTCQLGINRDLNTEEDLLFIKIIEKLEKHNKS